MAGRRSLTKLRSCPAFAIALVAMLAASGALAAGCYDTDLGECTPRFRLAGGEAHDGRTGLVWQRCSLGKIWNGSGCAGEISYLGLDEAIAAAQGGWRVPSGPELESLVQLGCGSPVVDQSIFPDIRPDVEGRAKYWTTNPVGTLDLYWNFDFIDGQPDGNTRGIRLAVRLVRTGN
jgi:hypothetical protein